MDYLDQFSKYYQGSRNRISATYDGLSIVNLMDLSLMDHIASSGETLQTLIARHQDKIRQLSPGSSERELRKIRKDIADLALKQKSLFDVNDDRDKNSDEIDVIVHKVTENLSDEARQKAMFLRRFDLLLVDAARSLEARREARKRRRTALNSTMVTTASGRTELLKRRTTRPLRSAFGPGGSGDLVKTGFLELGGTSLLRGTTHSNLTDHGDADFDVLDIDVAVSTAKLRLRRCRICHAGGDVECCSRCDAGYHVGICIPESSTKPFVCKECSKKNIKT